MQLQFKVCCSADLCLRRKVAASLGHFPATAVFLPMFNCAPAAACTQYLLHLPLHSFCKPPSAAHKPYCYRMEDQQEADSHTSSLVTFPAQVETTVYPDGAHRAVVEAKAPGDIEPRLRVKLCRID